MSHYPSTQELAVFRRSIDRAHPAPFGTFTEPDDYAKGASILHPHAWSVELAFGIGRGEMVHGMLRSYGDERYILARREATAIRSRAYWAADCPNGWGLFASYAERVGGIPYWDDPIVSTDTWTEDEPRHPLPIRYQPAFTIG